MSTLYVSARCPHSKQIVDELRAKGVLDSYHVVTLENTRKSMLPTYVDRVPLLVLDGRILTDDELFDFACGAEPEAGGNMSFGNFSDLGAPLDDSSCETAGGMKNFYDVTKPQQPIVTPKDDAPDSRKFDMDALQKQRMMDVPQTAPQRM